MTRPIGYWQLEVKKLLKTTVGQNFVNKNYSRLVDEHLDCSEFRPDTRNLPRVLPTAQKNFD